MGTPGLQLSWVDGHVVAWQPGRGVYGGNLQGSVRTLLRGNASSSTRFGGQTPGVQVVTLHTPAGEERVMCQRLEPSTLASLAQLDHLDHLGRGARGTPDAPAASLRWFGSAFEVARTIVSRGRVVPRLWQIDRTWWAASWLPLGVDLDAAVGPLAAAMPPVVAAGTPGASADVVTRDVLCTLIDHLARDVLAHDGWRPSITDTRRPGARAMRVASKALHTSGDGTIRVDPELVEMLEELSDLFARIAQRAEGLPLLGLRLRLGLPGSTPLDEDAGDNPLADDASEPSELWPLSLEVVDLDDRSRWCTAADVVFSSPLADEVTRGRPAAQAQVRALVDQAAANIPLVTPWLAQWADHALEPRTRGIEIEEAAALLQAVPLLEAVDIELMVPESLSRRRPSTRGTATPSEGGHGRLTATALVDWTVVVDGTPVDEAALQRAAAAGAGLIDVGGRWVRVDQTDAQRALAALAEHRRDHAELSGLEVLRLAVSSGTDSGSPTVGMASVPTDVPAEISGTGWVADLLDGLPEATLTDGVVPDGFTATLRPYQVRGLGWLQFLHRLGFGGCLADDMGLGKTPTTLAHLAGLPGPHLVVCPLSVVRNWQREAARFTPLLRVAVHHGTGRATAASFAALAGQHDIVITTYQVAARDVDTMRGVPWHVVVLDEAQAVKNPATATAKAMRKIPAVQHLALTGTPVENRLTELWSIFNVVVPGLLGSLEAFRRRFSGPIERDKDTEAAAALRRMTGPFLLRRTKADKSLVPDLPDKVEQIAWAPLTREQATMYQAVVDQLLSDAEQAQGMRRRGLVLAALTRLKQICNHPAHALKDGSKLAGRSGKLHRFDELITDLLDADEQALVFTQFREMGELLQAHLRERFGLATPFLHGGVSKTGRDRMVDQFQDGTSPSPLLLVSLKAGGTGLNLTAASRVVHYDRWWNPAVEDQATDRAWRIGQTNSVFVHKLVCQGTIEERVDALINDKKALADAVIGAGGEAWLSEMSTDELRDLVTLDIRSAVGGGT